MKPNLYLIPSFDVTMGTTIRFSWLGNQPISNTLRIRNNSTNEIVYEQSQTTMRLEHNLSSSNLVNGTLYNASVMVNGTFGNSSEWSDVILFYCYTTPTFTINVVPGQVIQTQTYGVNITYSQPEGEQLQSYRVRVFNSNEEIIYDSNTRYVIDTVRITNLQDNGHYTIVATGETINGMVLTTGEIDFHADFVKSEAYFICELENMYDTGGIYIKSNIISVEGTSDSKVAYIDNDIADLTNNVVHFSKSFSISSDFTVAVKCKGYEVDKPIIRLAGNDEVITVTYRHDVRLDNYYFELVSVYKNNRYLITTECPPSENEVTIWIRRKDCLFSLEVGS